MSKAFTRESDDLLDQPALPRQSLSLPPGAKNYLTLDGARRLREKLERLVQVERPRVVTETKHQGLSGDSPRQRQLRMLDQRIQHLQQSMHPAVVVTPPVAPWEQVRFGGHRHGAGAQRLRIALSNRGGGRSRHRPELGKLAFADRQGAAECATRTARPVQISVG